MSSEVDCHVSLECSRKSKIRGSFNKLCEISPKELPKKKNTVYSCTFFKKSNSDGSSHVPDFQQKFIYWPLRPKPFLYGIFRVFFSLWTIFSTPVQPRKTFGSLKKIFDQTCFSVLIKHSSVNFIWFELLSQQKLDDKPLLKPRTLWFATFFNNIKSDIFVRIQILFLGINHIQTIQGLTQNLNQLTLSKNWPCIASSSCERVGK